MNLCCLTEAEVQNIIEHIYALCDCCETDIYNDSVYNDLSLDDITDLYD